MSSQRRGGTPRSIVGLLALFAVAWAAVAGGAAAAPPELTVPGAIVAEATSAAGASVSYTASAANAAGKPAGVACSPPEGATGRGTLTATIIFPLGVSTVTCTVSDDGAVVSTGSFTVTVRDTTPPVLTLPADMTAPLASDSGTMVDFAATARDAVDGDVPVACTPASGATFPVGRTTVTCRATDSSGNTSAGTFTVAVTTVTSPPPAPSPPPPSSGVDVTAPIFSNVPPSLTVEATSTRGASVAYVLPTATDAVDGPIAGVDCTPASGSLFQIGQTMVECNAFDAARNAARATFTVAVLDTTAPTLGVPAPARVYAASVDGIAANAPEVAAFLAATSATDVVDSAPTVSNDAPQTFPIGDTVVTFTARDAAGNTSRRSSALTVLPPPAGGQTAAQALPVPHVVLPPPAASAFTAASKRGHILLAWTLPSFSAFDHVELMRARADRATAPALAYRGSNVSFDDTSAQEGALYRYELIVVGSDGGRSLGVALTALVQPWRLLAPAAGATLRAPPQLLWARTTGATYYNLQLFRDGVKVLSIWPTTNRYTLSRHWQYAGRSSQFGSGTYRWYVWPGFGKRSERHYGTLLGQSSFIVSP